MKKIAYVGYIGATKLSIGNFFVYSNYQHLPPTVYFFNNCDAYFRNMYDVAIFRVKELKQTA